MSRLWVDMLSKLDLDEERFLREKLELDERYSKN